MSEQQAFDLEKETISNLKELNLARANIHEGGSGGDNSKYMSEKRFEFMEKTFERSPK